MPSPTVTARSSRKNASATRTRGRTGTTCVTSGAAMPTSCGSPTCWLISGAWSAPETLLFPASLVVRQRDQVTEVDVDVGPAHVRSPGSGRWLALPQFRQGLVLEQF